MGYRGVTAPIMVGADGLTGSRNPAVSTPTHLLTARNLTYETYTVSKEGGSVKYNAAAVSGSIQGGWDWWPNTTTQHTIVVTSLGRILRELGTATFGTALATLGTVSGIVPVFVEGGKEAATNARKLFIFTGKNPVKVVTGTGACATVSGPPADWTGTSQPMTGLVQEGRVWGFMGHRGYYSAAGNHQSFTASGAGSLAIYPGEGEQIVGATAIGGSNIVVWKQPRGIYVIDTTDASLANAKVRRISSQLGLAGPLAFTMVDGDVMFMDPSGELFMLSAVSETKDLRPRPMSDVNELGVFIRNNTNSARYAFARMLYYAAKRRVELALARLGETSNGGRLVLDVRSGGLRAAFNDFATAESLWLRKDSGGVGRPVAGGSDGFVRKLDQANRLHDSGGYPAEWQTNYTDFKELDPSLESKRKNFQFLQLVYESVGNWPHYVDVLIDEKTVQTITFSMGGAGAILGSSFILGNAILGGGIVKSSRRRMVGSGHRLSLRGRNMGAGESFSIQKALVQFTVSDER